jgi:hypothetical protein
MTDKTPGPTSTDSPSEAQGGPPVAKGDHAYNAPDLSPLAFLLAVVHDPSVPISMRILAAHHAAPYVAAPQGLRWEDRDPMDRLTIVIEGLGSNSVSVHQGQEPQPDAPGPEDHPPLMH